MKRVRKATDRARSAERSAAPLPAEPKKKKPKTSKSAKADARVKVAEVR